MAKALALAACILLAGCAGNVETPAADVLTYAQALPRADTALPGAKFIAAYATTAVLPDRTLQGTSQAWQFLAQEADQNLLVTVTANDVHVRPTTLPSRSEDAPSRSCAIGPVADSSLVADAITATAQWRHVWRVGEARGKPVPSDDWTQASMRVECFAGATFWMVETPMMFNEGGTHSTRSFLASPSGILAGYDGGEARGGVSYGQDGLAVEADRLFFDHTPGIQEATASFNTTTATRAAITLEVEWQGIPVPTTGYVVVTDPAGSVHRMDWQGIGMQSGLVLDPLDPLAASGEWSFDAQATGPAGLTGLRANFCSGVPTPAATERNPACVLLLPTSESSA